MYIHIVKLLTGIALQIQCYVKIDDYRDDVLDDLVVARKICENQEQNARVLMFCRARTTACSLVLCHK